MGYGAGVGNRVRSRRSERLWPLFSVHATKKLLDRVGQPIAESVSEPTTVLGDWYATVLFWKPQVGLLVNERTLFPVLMPLAPAATLIDRFPDALRETLEAGGIAPDFIEFEVAAMGNGRYAKTANRSLVGIMNEFTYLAQVHRAHRGVNDLVALALYLSTTPCGPLYKRHVSPDRELGALVSAWSGRG